MADGGRYRRRRHAVYAATGGGAIVRAAHQPHYQSLDYNTLNGGIARWFEPIEDVNRQWRRRCARSSGSRGRCSSASRACTTGTSRSISFASKREAARSGGRRPKASIATAWITSWCCSPHRENIASGTTTVHALSGEELGSFTPHGAAGRGGAGRLARRARRHRDRADRCRPPRLPRCPRRHVAAGGSDSLISR